MHCEAVRDALLDFANGETGPARAWTLRRHLAHCTACMEELAALRRLTSTLRRADVVPPEPAVPFALSPRRAQVPRVFAAATASLLIAALLLLPAPNQNRRASPNPGAAIAAALDRVNTWHFSGWKLIDGKQIPWDVWGRRTPWLYYERVGDTVSWSDGKRRLRVFAPNTTLKRPLGLVIQTAPDQEDHGVSFLYDPAYQNCVNSGQASVFTDGFTKLYAQTTAVASFRRQNFTGMGGVNENKLYTISKRDWLPTTYQLHFDNRRFARDTEYLQVHYDVDLPDDVAQPPSPDGYVHVDFMHPRGASIAAAGSVFENHGFRVQAEPAGVDRGGNVLIVVRGWLGGNRLTPDSTFSLNVSPFNGPVSGRHREQKIPYLYASNSSVPPGGDVLLPYVPLEPSEVAGAPPDTFRLSLSASPQVQVQASDQLNANGGVQPVTRAESLFTEDFHWRLSLPLPVRDLAAVLPVGVRPPLPSERDLDDQRRIYYNLSYDFQATFYEKVLPETILRKFRDPDGWLNYYHLNADVPLSHLNAIQKKHAAEYKAAEQNFRRRAIYWQERKIAALPRMRATSPRERYLRERDDTFLLAKLYQMAGDTTGMRRTLRRLIADTRTDTSLGVLHRQAQYMLRTGQFPTDAGYKGPS